MTGIYQAVRSGQRWQVLLVLILEKS